MKMEKGKKGKLWLWITLIAVALAAAVGITLAFVLQPASPDAETELTSEIYWNVDKLKFTEGDAVREQGEDGLYHIRFASQGQLMELAAADARLVRSIDTMDAMGLVMDADGLIVDIRDVKDFAVETAKAVYVKSINGNTVTVNSSIAMNGMELEVELTDDTWIMDVRPDTETLAQAAALEIMDCIYIYGTEEIGAKSVYLTSRAPESKIYLRAESSIGKPDESGIYTIPFACEGELVDLKCKDENLVKEIYAATGEKQVMGLTFDEEGYITGTINAAMAMRGKLLCTFYSVTAVDGTAITATKLGTGNDQGKVVTFNLSEQTEIVVAESGCGCFIGEQVETLQVHDYMICWTDLENNARYVKVDRRTVDVPMYFLKTRQYDSAKKETSRVPDDSGYYVYELVCEGKVVTVKTKDKELATKIDANYWQFFGLKVEGSIIKEYYSQVCVGVGGWGVGVERYISSVMGSIVTFVDGENFQNTFNHLITEDTKIYDVTGYYGTKMGTKTTLQKHDKVVGMRNYANEMTYIFVMERYQEGCKLYYNTARKYSTKTQETTRVPDEDGYYVYNMCCDGKEVEVKTKNKALATMIDAQNAPIVAMKVSGGIVKAAYPAIAGIKLSAKTFNYNYVNTLKDGTLSCYYVSNGEKKENNQSYKLAKNCKIYNVTTNFENNRGEKTTLRADDRIQAIRDVQTNELLYVWVMERKIDAPLYWCYNRQYSNAKQETTRTPDEDGYYRVELFVDGKIKTFKTKDKDIMSQVDAYSESAFSLVTDGDVILKVCGANDSKYGSSQLAGQADVMKLSGNNFTTVRNRPTASNYGETKDLKISKNTKIYDVCSYSETRWKEVKLEIGDRVTVYADQYGTITYIFVVYKHTRTNGHYALCSHCNQTVWWEPLLGTFLDADSHYYMTHDRTKVQFSVGKAESELRNVVLDLDGKSLSITDGNLPVYYNLTVIDSVGGGSIDMCGGKLAVNSGSLNLMNGGTVKNGLVQVNTDYGLTVNGGTLECDMLLDGVTIALEGKPQITGVLQTANGGKVDISKLSVDAVIKAFPTGIFTTESDNIAAYLNVFKPIIDTCKITVKGKALFADNVLPGPADPLKFMEGTQKALCPACQVLVTWTPITQAEYATKPVGIMQDNQHLYLAEDITYTRTDSTDGYFICAPGQRAQNVGKVACLHLNGNDLTITNARAFWGSAGTLNVMGSGTVSGNHSVAPATLGINTNGPVGEINLHSGTYVTAEGNNNPVIAINDNGGRIHLLKDATIAAKKNQVAIRCGVANLVPGEITVAGTITGGIIQMSDANPEKGFTNTFKLLGGNVEGGISLARTNLITVSGAAKVGGTGLNLTSGARIATAELTEGANVLVAARGIFTEPLAAAAAQAKLFQPAEGYLPIEVRDNALWTDKSNQSPDDLVFDSDGKAVCPACQEKVEWIALSTSNGSYNNTDGGKKHYYLSGDLLHTSSNLNFMLVNNKSQSCLHLNGYNLTFVNRIFVAGESTFNVIGDGIVTSSYANGPIFSNSYATINLYGGTYRNSVEGQPAIGMSGPVELTLKGTAEGVKLNQGTLVLAEGASAQNIQVAAKGKLQVAAGWSGTADVTFASAPVDGYIPETNGAAEGDFTGTLTSGENKLVNDGGRLRVELGNVPAFVLDPDGDGKAACPVCGGEEIQWTALEVGMSIGAGKTGHYYLVEDITDTNATFASTLVKEAVLCVHMNGKNLNTAGRFATLSGGGTINIMGEGTITGTGAEQTVLTANSGGTINVYDATVTTTSTAKPVATVLNGSSVNFYGSASIDALDSGVGVNLDKGTVTLNGAADVENISVAATGKLTVAADWTGTANATFAADPVDGYIPEANGAAGGDFTGVLTSGNYNLINDGGKLKLELMALPGNPIGSEALGLVFPEDGSDFTAKCPACGEEVVWSVMGSTTSVYNNTDGGKQHYYLSKDLVHTSTNINFMTVNNNGQTCLHLNGHDLTFVNRIFVSGYATLNVMGTGTVTSSYSNGPIYTSSYATFNLYGGTYRNSVEGQPGIGLSGPAELTLFGSAAGVKLNQGTLVLAGGGSAQNIQAAAKGKVKVAADWCGTADVTFDVEPVDGYIPEKNGVADGDFTGTLISGDKKLINDGGKLKLVAAEEPVFVLDPDGDGKAVCPACGGGEVEWTALGAGKNLGYGKTGHYYLLNDSVDTSASFATSNVKEAVLCVHMNGKTLSTVGRIATLSGGGTINFMGGGTITGACSSAGYDQAVLHVNSGGTINLYDVKVTTTNPEKPVANILNGSFVNLYGSASIDALDSGVGINLDKGTVTLNGAASAENISVAANGKLIVAAGWTGTANATFVAELVSGQVPEKNGAATGDFTGTLKLPDNTTLINKDGLLAVLAG